MSGLRCWPGCMAIISGCVGAPENNGKIVEVKTLASDIAALYERAIWNVESREPLRAVNAFGVASYLTEFWAPDSHLTPITPPPDSDTTDESEDIFAERANELVGLV